MNIFIIVIYTKTAISHVKGKISYIIAHNPPGERETAGECRAYGIEHMHGFFIALNYEILDKFICVNIQQLRPDSGPAPFIEESAVNFMN